MRPSPVRDDRHGRVRALGHSVRACSDAACPESSILFFGLALACGLAAATAIRAYAHRLEITRPDGGHPVSVLVATRDLPRGTVLASTDVRAAGVPVGLRPSRRAARL